MSAEELAGATGISAEAVADLERFGLIRAHRVGGDGYYDEHAVLVASVAGGFLRHGIEARHLRAYKTAAEREAGLFEQMVMPLLKQRNPSARRQAHETLRELALLGEGLRAAMLRDALRQYLGG